MASQTTFRSVNVSVPSRGMRFHADGIQEWATSIAKGSGPVPFVGVLEGGAGQGTGALLSALEHVATERVGSEQVTLLPGGHLQPAVDE